MQKWRGHTGDRVKLTANGLRQGCTLSPVLDLVVINVLVSKDPDVSMPDWDEGSESETCGSRSVDGVSIL